MLSSSNNTNNAHFSGASWELNEILWIKCSLGSAFVITQTPHCLPPFQFLKPTYSKFSKYNKSSKIQMDS